MQVGFRVDASTAIGYGHWIRCQSLAQALEDRGHDPFFITSSEILRTGKKQRGSVFYIKNEDDVFELLRDKDDVSWLVRDKHDPDSSWEEKARSLGFSLLVFDDLWNNSHHADVVVNQNALAPPKFFKNKETQYLEGPTYAVLNPRFSEARTNILPRTTIGHIVVSYGGSDPTDETTKCIDALLGMDPFWTKVSVVVGPGFQNESSISRSLDGKDGFKIIKNPPDLLELFRTADLAFGSAGTTSWERCCLGLPSIVTQVVENQSGGLATLKDNNAAICLGFHSEVTRDMIQNETLKVKNDPNRMKAISENAFRLVDGLGASRIVDVMEKIRSSP